MLGGLEVGRLEVWEVKRNLAWDHEEGSYEEAKINVEFVDEISWICYLLFNCNFKYCFQLWRLK